MQDIVLSLATIFIPSVVSVIGFYLTYKQNKKYINNEILKNKKLLLTEKGMELMQLAIPLIDFNEMAELKNKKLRNLINSLYIYGSKEVIMILSEFMQFTYTLGGDKTQESIYKQMSYLTLIVSQLKYDFSGEIISPIESLKIRLTDYSKNEEIYIKSKKYVNEIVDKLKLNGDFKIN